MRFEVLGPLRVCDASGEVALPGGKARLLLALLLSRANQAVPVDTLADAVWEGRSPDAVARTMRWHVHQLRRLLGGTGSIVHSERGYLLRAAEGELDSSEFERLLADGLAAHRRGDAAGTAARLSEALALWRGPAFGDLVDCPLLRDAANRLDQRYLAAVELRCAAEISVGNHAGVVVELTDLVARYPLREKFRAQLMLALYRCGRRADALEVYRDGRAILTRELALEPGPELRRLERAILTDDPALEPPAAADVPGELPPGIAAFTGRDGLVAELSASLTTAGAAPAVAAISGAGGVGKSALAIHVAHKVKDAFRDGQIYVNLHGATPDAKPLDPVEALGRFLRSLGAKEVAGSTDVDELASRFRTATAGLRLLVVLDDARDAAQVRPLLPAGPGCSVLITCRGSLSALDNAVCRSLDGLDDAEAAGLLSRLVGGARVSAEPEAVARLVRWCGGMPLALSICGARLRDRPKWTISALANLMADESRRLAELAIDDIAIRSSFGVSYQYLATTAHGHSAARMFRLLGLHPGADIDVATAAALADVTVPEAAGRLNGLVTARLVEDAAPGRYRMHDLMRLYAGELATNELAEGQRDKAVRRVFEHYLSTARRAAVIVEPTLRQRLDLVPRRLSQPGLPLPGIAAVKAWTVSERVNFRAVLGRVAGLVPDGPQLALAVTVALKLPLVRLGLWRDVLEVNQVVERVIDRVPDLLGRVMFHRDLGQAQLFFGRLPAAQENLERGMELCERLGDVGRRNSLLRELGNVHRRAGRTRSALDCLTESLRLSRQLDRKDDIPAVLTQLGFTYELAGRIPEAVDAHRQAAAQGTDPRNRAIGWTNLGRLQQRIGEPAAAIESLNRCLDLLAGQGNVDGLVEADAQWGLGWAHHGLGDFAEARLHWDRSAAILFELGLISAQTRRDIESAPHPAVPAPLQG